MTIAITAASGHFGALAVEAAVRSGQEVVAIARDPGRVAGRPGVEVRGADYDDPAAMTAALTGVTGVLLVSGNEPGRRVQQHRNVIDAARAAGVDRIVYTSAPRATASSLVLAPDHKATEEYLAASGLAWSVARNNWYNENYVQRLPELAQSGVLVAAAGSGRVASAGRADLAAGAVAALTGGWRDGAIREFGGDVAWDYHELAAAYAEVLGRPVVYEPVEPSILVAGMVAGGVPRGTAEFVAAMDVDIAQGALAEVTGELSTLIGRPTTPLVETLRSAAAAA